MSTSFDESDVHLLLGAYALDALDDAETAHFEAHLTTCDSCRRDLVGIQAASAELGAAMNEVPPPTLRAAVLAAVTATPQLPPVTAHAGSGHATGSAPVADSEVSENATVVHLRPRRRFAPMLAVAAAALLVVAGALGWRAATLSQRVDQLQASAATVTAVITAPDAATVTGPIAGGGRGTVVTSASLNQSVIVADGLPAPASGRVYQLWYMTGSGTATPAGFLSPNSDGQAVQPLAGPLDGAAAVGISVEPAGGSAAPTTAPVLALKV